MLGFSAVAPLAQSAEQLTLNQWVPGSSPGGCTSQLGATIYLVNKALFVVDVQVCMFFGQWPIPNADLLLSSIANRVLEARTAGTPVFWVQNDGPDGELDAPGMPYWELALAPAANERVIRKTTQNVFESDSGLAQSLIDDGIEELEIVGVQSELCLRASAVGALQAGFDIAVPSNLHGTYNQDGLDATEISARVQAELERLMNG